MLLEFLECLAVFLWKPISKSEETREVCHLVDWLELLHFNRVKDVRRTSATTPPRDIAAYGGLRTNCADSIVRLKVASASSYANAPFSFTEITATSSAY